jgi:hypothetical protein
MSNADTNYYKNCFEKLLKDSAFTCVHVTEKIKKALPELEIEQDGSFQSLINTANLLYDAITEIKEVRDEAISRLAAKNMLYDTALEEICKLKMK